MRAGIYKFSHRLLNVGRDRSRLNTDLVSCLPTRFILFLVVCVIGFYPIACSNRTTSDKDIVQINYVQLQEMLDAADEYATVLVDVRSPVKFSQRNIPGSINLPLPELSGSDRRLSTARRIIVYAGSRSDSLSPAAAKRLLSLGFSEVYDFRDGLEMWDAQQSGTETRNR